MRPKTLLLDPLIFIVLSVPVSFGVNPGCQRIRYTSAPGNFSSPDFPVAYPPLVDCTLFLFVAPPEHIVEVRFAYFDVGRSRFRSVADCVAGDFVKVYRHESSVNLGVETPWDAIMCGRPPRSNAASATSATISAPLLPPDVPGAMFSTGRILVLEFHSDDHEDGALGFRGAFRFFDQRLYKSDGQLETGTECDVEFTSSRKTRGAFFSPLYPSNYPLHILCSYRFNGSPQERVRILVEKLELETSDESCSDASDVVRILDGRSPSSPVIAIVCGRVEQREYFSTGPSLLLELRTNGRWPGQGFSALYEFLPLNKPSIKVSEQTGEPYANILPATRNQTRGSNPWSEGVFMSSSSPIWHVECGSNGGPCEGSVSGSSGTWGSVVSTGVTPGSNCKWDLEGHGRQRVRIQFNSFGVGSPPDVTGCKLDKFRVSELLDGRVQLLAELCGSYLPPPIMSTGSRLTLEMITDVRTHTPRPGFHLEYAFSDDPVIGSGIVLQSLPCAALFNQTSGMITSPNYPGQPPPQSECIYLMEAEQWQRIEISFDIFNIGTSPCDRSSAYVEFRDNSRRGTVWRRCGNLRPFSVKSRGPNLRVVLRTREGIVTPDATGTAFRGQYRFVRNAEGGEGIGGSGRDCFRKGPVASGSGFRGGGKVTGTRKSGCNGGEFDEPVEYPGSAAAHLLVAFKRSTLLLGILAIYFRHVICIFGFKKLYFD